LNVWALQLIFNRYLELIRKLVLTYTLEPAGSHGVWGLDDHSFIPYIFGSAQYGPSITSPTQPVPTEGSAASAPSPSKVTDEAAVAQYKHSNMYFSAIQFIYDVKRGPFWEHSPVLYDISGIKDGWGKINKGMLKMYAAEVLGKFPVVQHFPFGSLFQWEMDPSAVGNAPSVHAVQQPKASMSPNTSSSSASSGTKAPWASSGMAPTRAPWAASATTAARQGGPPTAGINSTAAPWAATQRMPVSGAAAGSGQTAAPWVSKSNTAPDVSGPRKNGR
jgi:serine/threonine-protein phosphatase 2A activator